MADDAGAAGGPGGPGGPGMGKRGGFRGGLDSGIRGRGRGGGWGPGGGRGARGVKAEDKEWMPLTKLGRLIYLFSLPIKESETIDFFLGASLKDEVLKIMPVQKQTRAGQRSRFRAFVAIGDYNDHVGLGVKCSKEVATAIRGAIILAKLSIVPVRRGYRGNKIGKPDTVPCKVTGHWKRISLCPWGRQIFPDRTQKYSPSRKKLANKSFSLEDIIKKLNVNQHVGVIATPIVNKFSVLNQ
uniref:40S ribosomal protein S2 n=1 Tax=Colobus angolensis palliatus TaxID=336983 RepID=A0A2K5IJ70_COLAP